VPKDIVNRDFWAHQKTKNFDTLDLPYDKADAYPVLEKLSRQGPQYQRNLPQICSFFVKGECSRGIECPYRHEIPEVNELSEQNLKDRYMGINDPVAKKILRGFSDSKVPNFPADKSITTLYIGGVTDDALINKDLLLVFSKYGEVKNIKIMLKNYCAFITFADREGAENAITNLFNKCMIKGQKYKLMWGRPVSDSKDDGDERTNNKKKEIVYKTEMPVFEPKNNDININSSELINQTNLNYHINLNTYSEGYHPYYPSMDKNSMGGKLNHKKSNNNVISKKELSEGEVVQNIVTQRKEEIK